MGHGKQVKFTFNGLLNPYFSPIVFPAVLDFWENNCHFLCPRKYFFEKSVVNMTGCKKRKDWYRDC
jgi:hypothetical protein